MIRSTARDPPSVSMAVSVISKRVGGTDSDLPSSLVSRIVYARRADDRPSAFKSVVRCSCNVGGGGGAAGGADGDGRDEGVADPSLGLAALLGPMLVVGVAPKRSGEICFDATP